jgi:uncharacterized protein
MLAPDRPSTQIPSSDRIISLDVLRGIAVLAILIINIQTFSMIGVAFMNPTTYQDLTGLNFAVWFFGHLLVDQKFISIFSMLFGAGILIMSGKRPDARRIHYRRMLWLMFFGLLHAYVLWYGDILFTYAICGMILYGFRNSSPRKLLIFAAIFIFIPFLLWMIFGLSIPHWPEGRIQEIDQENWRPLPEYIRAEVDAYRGSWSHQMTVRAEEALVFQTFVFLLISGWKSSGLMLIGMAFYKLGILTAERDSRFFVRLMIVGFLAGFPLILFGVYENFKHQWDVRFSLFFGPLFNYWGSLFVAFGWIALVMLVVKSSCCLSVVRRLAAVGRMAFTNYILQTLICTTIFYGHGFGLFGSVSRTVQFLITISIWIILIVFSNLWLKFFHYGPLEWLWRSLTYWTRIRNKKSGITISSPEFQH